MMVPAWKGVPLSRGGTKETNVIVIGTDQLWLLHGVILQSISHAGKVGKCAVVAMQHFCQAALVKLQYGLTPPRISYLCICFVGAEVGPSAAGQHSSAGVRRTVR